MLMTSRVLPMIYCMSSQEPYEVGLSNDLYLVGEKLSKLEL